MAQEVKSDKEFGKFLLGLAVGIGLASLIKKGLKEGKTFNEKESCVVKDKEEIEAKGRFLRDTPKTKFWFFLSVGLFIIALGGAYEIIYVGQALPHDEPVVLTAYPDSGGDFMGLKPPFEGIDYSPFYLKKFVNKSYDAKPSEFSDYIESNESLLLNITDYRQVKIVCEPISDIFEEGGSIKCDLRAIADFTSYPSKLDLFARYNDSVRDVNYTYWFWAYPTMDFSMVPILGGNETIPNWTYYGNGTYKPYWLFMTSDKGQIQFKIILKWNIVKGYQIFFANGSMDNKWLSNSSSPEYYPAITYLTQDINVRSREDAAYLRQKDRERTPQFLLAIFVLFAVPTAVYYLRKLWRDTE